MLPIVTCLCLVSAAYAGGIGYDYASASVPQPQVLAPPLPDPAPAAITYSEPAPVTYSEAAPAASHQHVQHLPVKQEYVKEFFYFNAPQEHHQHHTTHVTQQAPTTVKKHLNVILIKAPENHVHEKAVRNIVKNVVEETQTHIYVLNKEPNHGALKKIVQQQVTHHSHKPEVHFVKYHTPAEAHQKQQEIVQQYGGGHIVNLGSGTTGGNGNVEAQFASTNVNRQYLAPPSNGYIPPKFF